MPAGEEAPPSRIINMPESGADIYIVADVLRGAPDAAWRWTNQHPRLQLKLDPAEGWILKAKFITPKVVLDRTGPLTVTFVVNGATVGTETYAADKANEFQVLVPPDVLKRQSPVVFGMDIDKAYLAEDGVKLCLLLEEIGFEEVVAK